jgi:drug/metabolite transporter (DMT)-like permease
MQVTNSPGIGFPVLAMTLGAAVLHATWNAIAHGINDRLVGFALIGLTYTVVCAVMVSVTGLPPAAAWAFIVTSAVLHTGYQLLLLASYELGEFSQAYPLARGTSPWVIAVVSTTALHRALPISQLIGVLVISAGLIGLVAAGGHLSRAQLPALAVAVLTGIFIAAYTTIDGLAVGHTPVLSYAGWMFLLQGPALPVLALARRRRALLAQLRPVAAIGLTGGAVSLVAYGLVLWAQQSSGALAVVAALRETSVIIGALIGAVFLGERLGTTRALAATVVVTGIILLSA